MAKGIGIHIGLNKVDPNHYDGWDGELAACEFDAQDMQAISGAQGMESTILITPEATADNVKAAISDAAGKLEPGDLLFLTYSGHGGQLTDVDGDEQDDNADETWVLFDRQLIDDELWNLWAQFQPGVRILQLSDSCHSGSVNRATQDRFAQLRSERGAATRELPRDVQARTFRAHRDEYSDIAKANPMPAEGDVGAHILLISGCQDDQLSLDGVSNGLFTENLLRAWDSGGFHGDYPAFHQSIIAQMPPTQQPRLSMVGPPSDAFRGQRPFTV